MKPTKERESAELQLVRQKMTAGGFTMPPTKKYRFDPGIQETMERLPVPFAVYQFIDGQVITIVLSDGFCRLLGYSERDQACYDMDHDMYKDAHPDDVARITREAFRFASGEGSEEYEAVFRTKAGVESDYHVVHAHGIHVYPEPGVRLAYVWYIDEGVYIEGDESAANGMNRMINSVLHQESILRAANYDSLTGLPSLAYFFKRCEIEKERFFSEGKQACLLYIDLNGMKYYNHRNGFAAGDRLLQAFADLLAKTFGHEECCHIGADRFAAASREVGLEDRLRLFFDETEKLEEHLPVRVGIYSTSIEDVPVSNAYDRAKMACDSIRKLETSSFQFYTRDLSEADKNRRYILSNIDRAISEKWIQVYYQPIVRAANSRVCEEEALARWTDPEKGILSPAEFIPHLEESGQIYKLDLYMLEQVLVKMRLLKEAGLTIVPQSINLSRSDFSACDIVEEIRKRVDGAGVRHEMITVEITESIIGSDFEYMKAQIQRFQQLGFPVWLDDFGSGYSSLEVLQSIRFDLIKFDMSFMRRLNEGDSARIVLTELMKMAASLGVSTVCEGVETEEQASFLREIGCSKLQGYYFCKPVPIEEILDRYKTGRQIGFEDPDVSGYFETIGRINLYDLDVVASQDENLLHNSFNTIPVGIIEINGNQVRLVRSNPSYREFLKRFFGLMVPQQQVDKYNPFNMPFVSIIAKNCTEQGKPLIYDETMPDGSVVHSFARRIDVNPKTGDIAVAVAILSISQPDEVLPVERILSVLGQIGDHIPGGFFIYRADESEGLLYANKAVCDIFGCESLDEFKAYTGFTFRGMVHPADYEMVAASVTKQVRENKDDQDYVEYRIVRKDGGIRWITDYGQYMESGVGLGLNFVFVSDNTDMHQQAESDKAIRSAVIEALTNAYDSLWLIRDVETQQFELYRIDPEMEHLMPAHMAVKIRRFSDALAFYSKLVLEEDRQRFLDSVTAENIVKNTSNSLIYSVPFRRVFDSEIRHYRVEFTRLDLPGGKTGIVGGFKNVDEEVKRSQQTDSKSILGKIAEAFMGAFSSIYIVNSETNEYRWYSINAEYNSLQIEKSGQDFFTSMARDARLVVYEEDQHIFTDDIKKETLTEGREKEFIYRLMIDGKPLYHSMRLIKGGIHGEENYFILTVRNIDTEHRALLEKKRLETERELFNQVANSLARVYDVIYYVNTATNEYSEFSSTNLLDVLQKPAQGTDFFEKLKGDARTVIYPQDLEKVLAFLNKNTLMSRLRSSAMTSVEYRLQMGRQPVYVRLSGMLANDDTHVILCVENIDEDIRILNEANEKARRDSLTGVRNKYAYFEEENLLQRHVENQDAPPFAIAVFDLNDLKKTNDTQGHAVGDELIIAGCRLICNTFKHSPVFRIGGDEFAAILSGQDYDNRELLLRTIRETSQAHQKQGAGVIVASGIALYDPMEDHTVADVFKRADEQMYRNKKELKAHGS